jgi:hypothetical protein
MANLGSIPPTVELLGRTGWFVCTVPRSVPLANMHVCTTNSDVRSPCNHNYIVVASLVQTYSTADNSNALFPVHSNIDAPTG